jgi:uncharacterized repeat protein (TIGR01451 family)
MLCCICNKQIVTAGIDSRGYFTRRVTATRILLLLMGVIIWLTCAGVSHGAIIINAPMTDTNATGWVLGGNPTSSLLTGNGTIDPVGSGWLRLTSNSGNQTGFAYNTTSFDLSLGLLIQFDYTTWGGTGADGYSVYLFDAGVSTFNIGAFGGSLGYAQKLPPAVTPAVPGISGGYVGIGVDEYGNFSNPTEGRYLGPGAYPNTVTIRGPVVGFGGGAIGDTINASSYPWIATSANNGSLWYNGATRPDQTSANYRRVTIQITPAPNPVANVWIQFGYNTSAVQMITNQALPAISTSQSLMMGYAASTGGSTNYHEIRNLLVTNASTTTSINLGIAKSFLDTTTSSTTATAVGDGIRYTVTARNYGPNNVTATGVGIVDNIPAAITGVSWTCAVVAGSPAGTSCGAASGSGNTLNTTANLPYGGAVTYTINGTVSAPAPSTLSNTASLVIPGSVTDYNPNDNSITVSIPVTSNLSTSTKTWLDLNGGDQNPNDVLQFTITLKETVGAAASGVSVTDTLPATLTNLTIISFPAGATNSSTGSALNITGVSVPANGSATIVFQATIANGTAAGTLINNTATISNPNGTGATPSSPTITVSASIVPATGNKPLYLYGGATSPYKMSRYPTPGTPTTAAIAAAGGSAVWNGNWNGLAGSTLPLQLNDTITSASATLYINGSSNNARTVEVRLYCSSNAAAYASWPSAALPTNPPVPPLLPTLYTFNLTTLTGGFAFPATCATPNYWVLQVFNRTATAGQTITVVPVSGANISKVLLASNNVINVSSVNSYSAAYPSVSTPATGYYVGLQWVYVRAVVSDPFGSFDITSAAITIKDPNNNVVINAVAMPQVADSGAATKTYEYAYQIPSTGPSGFWTASVTAKEGTENTVSHTAAGAFHVVLQPLLTVVKSSNPSPSVNPGQVVTYTEIITNTGTGTATSVVVTDSLSPYVQWGLNSYGAGVAFQFVDGTPASGLTLGAPVYSNNNGTTWVYTPVSGGGGAPAGYDGNVTNWQTPMTGTMNANGANFTINYKVRVK